MLWPLIPMFTLWANFHGGYIVGLGAMGIAAAVMFVQGWFGDADRMRSAWRLGLITVGCAAATVINPFGVGLWFGVAHSVGDPLIRQVIADWVPLPNMMLTRCGEVPRSNCSHIRDADSAVRRFCRGGCLSSRPGRRGDARSRYDFHRRRVLCHAQRRDWGDRSRDSAGASCQSGARRRWQAQQPQTMATFPPAAGDLRDCGGSRWWNALESAQDLEADADRRARVHAAAQTSRQSAPAVRMGIVRAVAHGRRVQGLYRPARRTGLHRQAGRRLREDFSMGCRDRSNCSRPIHTTTC